MHISIQVKESLKSNPTVSVQEDHNYFSSFVSNFQLTQFSVLNLSDSALHKASDRPSFCFRAIEILFSLLKHSSRDCDLSHHIQVIIWTKANKIPAVQCPAQQHASLESYFAPCSPVDRRSGGSAETDYYVISQMKKRLGNSTFQRGEPSSYTTSCLAVLHIFRTSGKRYQG